MSSEEELLEGSCLGECIAQHNLFFACGVSMRQESVSE